MTENDQVCECSKGTLYCWVSVGVVHDERLRVGCRERSLCMFFFQAEDGIRDLVRSRGLGDVYKRQTFNR